MHLCWIKLDHSIIYDLEIINEQRDNNIVPWEVPNQPPGSYG